MGRSLTVWEEALLFSIYFEVLNSLNDLQWNRWNVDSSSNTASNIYNWILFIYTCKRAFITSYEIWILYYKSVFCRGHFQVCTMFHSKILTILIFLLQVNWIKVLHECHVIIWNSVVRLSISQFQISLLLRK